MSTATSDRVGGVRSAGAVRLRPTLVATIVGAVLLTAFAIGGSTIMLTLHGTRTLIDQTRIAAVASATEAIRDFFAAAPYNTSELAAEARRGALPLDRPDRLAALFAERLRDLPQLAWIGYGDRRTGRYVGATRNDPTRNGRGEIIEYVADPRIAGGIPRRIAVIANDARAPLGTTALKPYFVVTRDWFRLGLSAPGPIWTDFYRFTSGRIGITCATRWTAPGAAQPAGVFHADLRVTPIAAFLSTLRVGRRGAVFLTDPSGHPIVAPSGRYAGAAQRALDAAAAHRSRPVRGVAITVASGGHTYEVVFAPIPVEGNLGFDVAVVVNLADITDGIVRQALVAGATALGATLLAIIIGVVLAARIARPVVAIAEDLATVGAFDISRVPSPRSFVREIAELGQSVDRMKASLNSFGRYVPTDLVRTLLMAGSEARLGGEIRRLSIFFSDIADFTAISEGMEPHQLVAALGRYFATMTDAVTRHGGTIDKFMGDGVMAFFNAPLALSDHARQACLAALAAQAALARLYRECRPGEPVFRTRIGLGLGDVLVGNIGTPERFAYTIIGDEVNLASRCEGLNKLYGTAIIAGDPLAAEAGDGFEWRRLDKVAVKGRRQGTLVCELLGEQGAVAADILKARDLYERALDAYFAGDFIPAAAGFLAARPGDRAARMLAERARALAAAPPAAWNGIHAMHEK